MHLQLRIEMDNAAFEDYPDELWRLLRALADHLNEYPPTPGEKLPRDGGLIDRNGSKVGQWSIDN